MHEEQSSHSWVIRGCHPRGIWINDTSYLHGVLLWDTVTEWSWEPTHCLPADVLGSWLALQPDVVLLGTGTQAQPLPTASLRTFWHAGIGVETMRTDRACEAYNILIHESRRVLAALCLPS